MDPDGDSIEVDLLYYYDANKTSTTFNLPIWITFDRKFLTSKISGT